MIPALAHTAKRPFVLLYLAYALIGCFALDRYLSWQSVNVVLGLIALPIVTTVQRDDTRPVRFAWIALVLTALCLWLPVKTLLFFSLVFACFFVTESGVGRMNLLPVLVVGIMSPVFQYASNVLSFPLRLWLTGVAGGMMNMISIDTKVAGNMIYLHGNEYSVDPACMGLNMLVVGLLLQIMLIAIFQKQTGLQLRPWMVILLMSVSVVINVLSNLFRIICLVYFNVLPGTLMHEVAGIICLLVYVVLPMIYITRWVVKRVGKVKVRAAAETKANSKRFFVHAVLLTSIGLAAGLVFKQNNESTAPVQAVAGFKVHRVDADIVKLQNDKALIYIKKIPGFYSADHNPAICWKGSGYQLKQIEARWSVYTAVLENGEDRLYTAWWYDNGAMRTTSQLSWRWNALTTRSHFSLINVTAATQQQLQQQVQQLFQTRIL